MFRVSVRSVARKIVTFEVVALDASRWFPPSGADDFGVALLRGAGATGAKAVERTTLAATAGWRFLAPLEPETSRAFYEVTAAPRFLKDLIPSFTTDATSSHRIELGGRVSLARTSRFLHDSSPSRGTAIETAVARPNPRRRGGDVCVRITLDHGPSVWTHAEELVCAPAPEDTYERARRDPAEFLRALDALAPLARAEALRPIALSEGGGIASPVDAPPPRDVVVADGAQRLYALVRGLPAVDAMARLVAWLDGWLRDEANHETRTGELTGVEYAAGQRTQPYFRVYTCPIHIAVGALVLILVGAGLDRVPEAIAPRLAPVLERLRALPPHLFSTYHDPGAYLRASLASVPRSTAFEDRAFRGLPALVKLAADLGLPATGEWLEPTTGFGF